MGIKLPKIGNVGGTGRKVGPNPKQASTDYSVRIGALSQVSQARMSEIINGGAAERKAMVGKANLDLAETQADISIASSKSRLGKAVEGSVSQMADSFISAAEQYDLRETKHEVQKYLLGEREASVQFDKAYGGKTSYLRSEVPESIIDKLGIPDNMETVPAYMVYAEWKRETLQKSLMDNARSIGREDLRNNAISVAQGYEVASYRRDVADAQKTQPIYQRTEIINEVNKHLNNKDFDLATETIASSDLKKELKTKWLHDITNKKQNYELTSVETLDPANPETLIKQEHALELLRESWQKDNSALTNAQYRGHVDRLEGNIKAYKDSQKKVQGAGIALTQNEGTKTVELAYEGVAIPDEKYQKLLDVLKKDGSKTSLRLIQNMEMSRQYAKVSQGVNRKTIEEQRKVQSWMRDNIDKVDVVTAYVYNKQIKSIDKGISERASDAMSWGMGNGVIMLNDINYDDIAGSVFQLRGAAKVMEDHYKSFTGYMTKPMAAEFGAFLNNQDTKGKLEVFSQVFKGFEGDMVATNAFYEQFKDDGDIGTIPVAGQVMASGRPMDARKILEGRMIRKESPEYFSKELKTDAKDFLVGKLGTIYGSNNVERGMIEEAIYDAMAYDNQKLRDISGDFSNKKAEAALQAVTGGVAEYNDSYFQTPLNLTPRQTEAWIDDLSSEAFEATGYPEKVEAMVKEGDLEIIGVGSNMYRLTDDKGNEVKTTEGTSFQFSYSPDYPSKADKALQEKKDSLDLSGGKDPKTGKYKVLTDIIPSLLKKGGILGR